jgi:acetylglutamate kinase
MSRNAQADLQAIGRAHRIGQTRPVTVYRLTLQGTVEERILQVARQKLALAIAVSGVDKAATAKQRTELQQGLQASVVRFGVTQFVSQKIVSFLDDLIIDRIVSASFSSSRLRK